MKTMIPDYSPLLIAALVFSLTSAALSSRSPALFVPMRCPRRKVSVGAVLSPLDQGKLDFVGSLENAYDPNHENPVSTSFLRHLVDQVGSRKMGVSYSINFIFYLIHRSAHVQIVRLIEFAGNSNARYGGIIRTAGYWKVANRIR
jgi:hypothetical protein